MKHMWENNKCTKCGLIRERKTWRRRMAIVNGKDHYQYGTAWAYFADFLGLPGDQEYTFERPECKP